MKMLTYLCLSFALVGTLLLMNDITVTGGHIGKGAIENAVADIMPEAPEKNSHLTRASMRTIECAHLAVSGYICEECAPAEPLPTSSSL